MHWKDDSAGITQNDLDTIFKSVFGSSDESSIDGNVLVIENIHHEANECLNAVEGINFENKIVLSIAVRIAAEKFMVEKINDTLFISSIDSNQTPKLFERYKQLFSNDVTSIEIILRVLLMTPENIHVNSFMYEPILDMSDEHLRKLYRDVMALK